MTEFTLTNTKQIRDAYNTYLSSSDTSLYDIYKKPSRAKEEAFEYCKSLMKEFDGSDLRIVGSNMMEFSAGFIFSKDNEKYFMYITKCYDRVMKI